MTQRYNLGRVLAVLMLAIALIVSASALGTNKPLVKATETIVVPNVQTGAPMELEVSREASSSADAAAYLYMNCSLRFTDALQVNVAPYGVNYSKCGGTAGLGGNSISQVRDLKGPICVYYGSTLAGCAGIGSWAYVGNRSGYTGTVKTQPIGS